MSDALVSLKCPSCGGTIAYNDGDIACECPFCTTQFLVKDAIQARSIDHLATAIEKTAKPSYYDIEVEKAALQFARVWNNGECNPLEAREALNRLVTLDGSDEVKAVQENLSGVVAIYERFCELMKMHLFMQKHTPAALSIMGIATLFCYAVMKNTVAGVIGIALCGFWLLVYLCICLEHYKFLSRPDEARAANEKVTNSLNTLLSRFKK